MPPTRHAPADSAATPLTALRTAELFLVHAVRLWTAHFNDPTARIPDWREGFMIAGLDEDGASAFHAMLQIIAVSATRRLDIRCLGCARLGGDEARLLDALSLLQHAKADAAWAVLEPGLPPAALRLVLEQARIVARALAAARLAIPPRRDDGAAVLHPFRHGDRGLALMQ